MIDTVSLRQHVPLLPPTLMSERGFSPTCGHASTDDHYLTWKLNLPRDKVTWPRLTWSSTPSGDWLTTEVSLPKLRFGNNVQMVSEADVGVALEDISRFISQTAGIAFDTSAALIGRVVGHRARGDSQWSRSRTPAGCSQ